MRPLYKARLPALEFLRRGHVHEISEPLVRENLQSGWHLERVKAWPRRQRTNGTCAPIPGLLQGAHNAGIVATVGIAEHPNFPPGDVLKNLLARTDFLS